LFDDGQPRRGGRSGGAWRVEATIGAGEVVPVADLESEPGDGLLASGPVIGNGPTPGGGVPEEGFGDAGFGAVDPVVDARQGGPESFGVGTIGRVNGGVAPGDDGVGEFDDSREEDGFQVLLLGVGVEELVEGVFIEGVFIEGVFETAAGENGDGFLSRKGWRKASKITALVPGVRGEVPRPTRAFPNRQHDPERDGSRNPTTARMAVLR